MGVILFTKIDADGRPLETIGKFAALGIGPLVGALVGRHLASYLQGKVPTDSTVAAPPPPAPVSFVPTVAPILGTRGSTGVSFGLDGTF